MRPIEWLNLGLLLLFVFLLILHSQAIYQQQPRMVPTPPMLLHHDTHHDSHPMMPHMPPPGAPRGPPAPPLGGHGAANLGPMMPPPPRHSPQERFQEGAFQNRTKCFSCESEAGPLGQPTKCVDCIIPGENPYFQHPASCFSCQK